MTQKQAGFLPPVWISTIAYTAVTPELLVPMEERRDDMTGFHHV